MAGRAVIGRMQIREQLRLLEQVVRFDGAVNEEDALQLRDDRACGAEPRSEDGIAAATATTTSAASATAAPTPAMNAGRRERD